MMALQHAMCVVLFAWLVIPSDGFTLRVAAFNIQVFGVSKMSKPDVVNVLRQILIRYDITLIQEIRDDTNTAIHQLLSQVNGMGAGTWDMKLSERLGRTNSKEQYAYFYKTSTVSVVDDYQWPDASDVFERPPYIVRFRARSHVLPRRTGFAGVSKHRNNRITRNQRSQLNQRNQRNQRKPRKQRKQRKQRNRINQRIQRNQLTGGDFGFIGIHVKPDDAVNEIDGLADVYHTMVAQWGISDFIIGGDFNAGGRYVTADDLDTISLRTDGRFLWVIGDNIGTTFTNYPYDRLVLAGVNLQSSYVDGSATPYNYETALGINHHALALQVSDHYPVEMEIRRRV